MNTKKWILFFILMFFTYIFVIAFFSLPLVMLFVELSEFFKIYQYMSELEYFDAGLAVVYLVTPFVIYGYAKVFGIFKDIDSLKLSFRRKLLIVTLVAFFIFVLMYLPLKITDAGFAVLNNFYSYSTFFLIPDFLFYKLFQYLTLKFPNPFEQMAYYFSIRFYKTLIKNSYQKIKNKFTK